MKKEGTGLRKQKEGINEEKYKPKTTGNTQRRTKQRLRRTRLELTKKNKEHKQAGRRRA